MNKLYILFFSLLISCKNRKKDNTDSNSSIIVKSGKETYEERCTSCHGSDGKLGFGGAKDLTLSKKTLIEINHQVTNGKGAMAPYKNILSIDEIDQVSSYAFSLQIN